MIERATDVMPKFLIKELLRLARIDRDWCEYVNLPNARYKAHSKLPTFLRELWISGADAFSMWALSTWLIDGPKIFRPTVEQCEALEQVAVNVELTDYAQPYPAILIDLPPKRYGCYTHVICHHSPPRLLTCLTNSDDNLHDVATTVAVDGRPIEVSLQKFDDDAFRATLLDNDIVFDPEGQTKVLAQRLDKKAGDVHAVGQEGPTRLIVRNVLTHGKGKIKPSETEPGAGSLDVYIHPLHAAEAAICGKALRVAVNSCLALANFGCHAKYLFPKELVRDRSQMVREERERRHERPARDRVKLAPSLVSFVRDVKLHHTERISSEHGEPTGKEKPTHWRRGHWHTVIHGVGRTQRKLKLFPPVLVRADRITDQERVSTVYHT
jgi:hypothetical protein